MQTLFVALLAEVLVCVLHRGSTLHLGVRTHPDVSDFIEKRQTPTVTSSPVAALNVGAAVSWRSGPPLADAFFTLWIRLCSFLEPIISAGNRYPFLEPIISAGNRYPFPVPPPSILLLVTKSRAVACQARSASGPCLLVCYHSRSSTQ